MIASPALALIPAGEIKWFALLGALSSRFGGEAEPLKEDEILRLVASARAGDRNAGQKLYLQYVDQVFRTVRGMLRSDFDAEEVTQDAMLTVLTSLGRYSPRTGTRFIAWVSTIAVNTARRRFRRRRPELSDPLDLMLIPDENSDLERDADTQMQRTALLRALSELDDRDRDIVSLRYGSELDAGEIASVLMLEPANVRKILERLRERLGLRIGVLMKLGERLHE